MSNMAYNIKNESNARLRLQMLADPERVRKDLEHQRRITRLQQVREKSNNMARHIRQEVAAEQTRQLQKLESVKQHELNVWREHVMAKKHQDYRTSVFQVGAAHRAALVEIERSEQQKQLQSERMKKCRRLASLQRVKHTPANVQRATGGRDLNNVEGRATAGTQTPVQKSTDGKENRCCKSAKCPGKCNHKKAAVRDEAQLTDCSSTEEEDEQVPSGSSRKRLHKTPPIILDVDIQSEDSLEICTRHGIEINDRHIKSNRQFSRIVRSSPSSSPVRQPVEKCVSRPRFTQISDLVRRNTMEEPPTLQTSTSPSRSMRATTKSTTSEATAASPTRTSPPPKAASPRRTLPPPIAAAISSPKQMTQKRSSLRNSAKPTTAAKVIDAGIKRSAAAPQTAPVEEPRLQPQLPSQEPAMQLPQSQMQHQQLHVQPLPMQQMQPLPPYMPQPVPPHAVYAAPMMPGYPPPPMMPYAYAMQPYPTPGNYAGPQPLPVASSSATVAPPTRTTTTTATRSSVSTSSCYAVRQKPGAENNTTNTAGRVQFYDHNNKYYRNYKAPERAVQANLPDATHLNAMDHARIETQLNQLREQEMDKLRKVTEERGQKALQREQVRRDCAELTEKLDALTQQQPQLLPTDANFVASHRYADLASRREQKMNEAMEQMLLRPAIVTCPEVGRSSNHNSPRKLFHHTKSNAPYAINVGEPPIGKGDEAVDSASCCSLLLDYVDDQSKQLRTELKGMHSKSAKSMKLRNLLQRIDKIRAQLLSELKAGDMSGDNAQKVIDSIRQERANLNTDVALNLDERELALQKKEAILEQRLRQLYKHQQKLAGQKERQQKGSDEGTHEIIIKVRSDGTVKQCVPKGKSQSKPSSKVITEPSKPSTSSSSTEGKQAEVSSNQRQNSIDSNSTAYRELPPVNYENIRAAAAASTAAKTQTQPLNPIIAHYVQRLLTMSQSSINQLGVSSSDVSTPSDSIVNQPGNRSSGPTADDTLIDPQRMERVQAFIQENRSFINELEDTLQREQEQQQQQRQQKISDQQTSEQVFDQIWMKRLASKKQHQQQQQQKELEQPAPQSLPETDRTQNSQRGQTRRSVTIAPDAESTKNTARSLAQLLTSQMKSKQIAISETKSTSRSSEMQTQSKLQTQTMSKTQSQVINEVSSSSDKSAARHVERYAKLTENCTQRIAELTELITKVRDEKNRLVEVTLTSASEAERHSTEYLDLPQMPHQGQQREQRGSRTVSEGSDATQSNSEALPLQKHKSTGASLDSGISVSRPMTALGQQELPETEPLSLGSSSQPGSHRRSKAPPATIRRYSPQLAAEELAHELSTITEIDTPAQSHIVAAQVEPIPFPTFEQYARELHVDVSQMDANQSMRMQHEFEELIKTIREAGLRLDYREFPSIRAYLHETSSTQLRIRTERTSTEPQTSMTAVQLLKEMRLNNVSIHEFPTRREYMQRLIAQLPPEERDLIDSASLDSSDSFNVEAELRQRRLLKASFKRGTPSDVLELDVASSTRRESNPPNASAIAPDESGIDHLSRSHEQAQRQYPGMQQPAASGEQNQSRQHSGMHHSAMQPITIHRMGTLHPSMRQRDRQLQSNSSSSSESDRQPRSIGTSFQRSNVNISIDPPQDVSQIGRSLNLRDFLTKELLKHGRGRRLGSGSEGSDDSLKGQFLQSVIDSLSPSTSPATPGVTQGTNATNDRQKTSTPVGSFTTGYEAGGTLHSSDSQLFSMDSHISAVNYADGTPPIPYTPQSLLKDSKALKTARK